MGQLFDRLKAAAGERSLGGAIGAWRQAVSTTGDWLVVQVNFLLATTAAFIAGLAGILPIGGVNDLLKVNRLGTALEWTSVPPVYVAPMDWATFIALVNANAYSRPVVMGPGTWTCDVAVSLASGAHIIGGPGVTINSTIPLTVGFSEFVFYKFAAFSAVLGTLSANAAIGADTLSSSVSIAVGTRIWVGQTAATGHTFLSSQYTVLGVAGIGPYTLTLDRAVLFPFVTGDELREITEPTDDITIDGRGMTVTGRGDRAVEFTGANRCTVSGIHFTYDGTNQFGAGVSLDIGSLDSTISDVVAENGSVNFGCMLESAEHCAIQQSRVEGGSNCHTLYDCVDCAIEDCSGSDMSNAGALLTSNLMTVGCFDCRVVGGNFSHGANIGVNIGYATDCVIRDATCVNNVVGIDTGTTAVRLVLDHCKTQRNTTYGFELRAAGTTVVSPTMLSEVYGIIALNTCEVNSPQIADYSSAGIIVHPTAVAGSRLVVRGGRVTSGQTGSLGADLYAMSSMHFDRVRFDNTGGAANQTAILHRTGAGVVVLTGCSGSQASANNGYAGQAGVTVRWDSRTDFSGFTTPFTINAAGFGSVGTLVSGGAAAAQAVAWPDLKSNDHVTWTRIVNGGAPGIPPLSVNTPATGFSATFVAGDTSTYEYRVE